MGERGTNYQIEWMVDPEAEEESTEELLTEIREEVSEDIQDRGRVRRNSIDPMTFASIAMLSINSTSLLIQIYQYLDGRDGSTVGIMKVEDGDSIYADNVEKTEIEEIGGTYIGNVEGDLNLFEISPEQAIELSEEREE
ncbi:hypothetical protein [Halococcus agarilyticus]|uniref:hypothetical protein n=1 Tax=Halococcus agarilyticus TaxID=1232219 RepID=UPI00067807FB|nr:hypothetical protein [Halococcus agarilyticus]